MDPNNSATAPRALAKTKSEGKLVDEELARLSRKKDSLKAAADDLYEEIAKIEEGIVRRNEVLKREEEARKEKTASSDQQKALVEAAKLDLDEKQQRRREILQKKEAKLRHEQELMGIGRHQMNADIKRHQCVVLGVIDNLKQRVSKERQEFMRAVVQEVDSFKLPPADTLFGTQNETLVAELKQLCDECLKLG